MAIGNYLAGIGALIWDAGEDRYLFLKRSDEKDYAPGAWECVTGRLDQGEGFEEALYREVREELGLEVRALAMLGTTHFYRGEARRENELVGVVYWCSADNLEEFHLSAEHSEFRWMSAGEAGQLLRRSHLSEHWLLKVIERAEATKRFMPRELIRLHREQGFELDG